MQLSDYAMIENSVPQDVKLKSLGDLQQQKQDIESSALNNQAKGMQIKQAQDAISEKDAIKNAVMQNTQYNPDGTSVTDHRAVANQLGQNGFIDAAHSYTLDQQKQAYSAHKDQMEYLGHLAQGVMSQPPEARQQAYEQAVQQAKQAKIDVTGHEQWDPQNTPNFLTGIISANQDAKTYFEQPEKILKAQADKARADAYVNEQESLANLHNSQKTKTDKQTVNLDTVQSPTISPDVINDIAGHLKLGMKLSDSPYAGLLTGAKNTENRNAVAARLTEMHKEDGTDPTDSLIAMQDLRSGNRAAQESGAKEGKVTMGVIEARKMIPIALKLNEEFDRSGFRPVAFGDNWWAKQTNDPSQLKLNAATESFIKRYDTAVNMGGGTVAGKEHARELLNSVQDMKGYKAVMGVLDQELQAAQDSPSAARELFHKELRDKNPRKDMPSSPNITNDMTDEQKAAAIFGIGNK